MASCFGRFSLSLTKNKRVIASGMSYGHEAWQSESMHKKVPLRRNSYAVIQIASSQFNGELLLAMTKGGFRCGKEKINMSLRGGRLDRRSNLNIRIKALLLGALI